MKNKPKNQQSGLTRLRPNDHSFSSRVEAEFKVLEFLIEFRKRMRRVGINQAQLARRIGVKKEQITRWMNAQSSLDAKSMFLLTQAVGFDLVLSWCPRSTKKKRRASNKPEKPKDQPTQELVNQIWDKLGYQVKNQRYGQLEVKLGIQLSNQLYDQLCGSASGQPIVWS